MKFDKSRCYSALNADELRAGDKVIVANTLKDLKSAVDIALYVYELTDILTESSEDRFFVNDRCYLLAYLVEIRENCTNCGCVHCWYREKHGIDEQRLHTCSRRIEPKTQQKVEKDCDNCGQRCDGYGKGEVCSQWIPKAEKHTDYNHCEEARKAYVCAMTNVCPNKHYRPFKDTDELIKVWDAKYRYAYGLERIDRGLDMPHIWVRHKGDATDRGHLIVSFSNNGCSVIDVDDIRVMLWEMLFGEWEFLDGSPCGVEA